MPQTKRMSNAAGRFFPDDAQQLEAMARALLSKPVPERPQPLAVISPHAGYRFSGALAARALGATAQAHPRKIVVLSPSHAHSFKGIALPSQDSYQMPGFSMAIHKTLRSALIKEALAHIDDAAHDQEHGIETQLPLLHQLHPKARLVPLVIGKCTVQDIARAIDFIADQSADDFLFVLSSDLSHYQDAKTQHQLDQQTAAIIETGQLRKLNPKRACGALVIAGFQASKLGKKTRIIRFGLTNSQPVTGNASRVVGYGAWGFFPSEETLLTAQEQQSLLRAARFALEKSIGEGKQIKLDLGSFAPPLHTHAASFVTLERGGKLRGCIGSLVPQRRLIEDVVGNTLKAALQDRRFKPVTAQELETLDIKISVLTTPKAVEFASEAGARKALRKGVDGAIIIAGEKRGTFLPQVWESYPNKKDFLNGLKRKAGLETGCWSEDVKLYRFTTHSFSEANHKALAA